MIWNRTYSRSSRDHGTLGYFRSLLNQRSVGADPRKCVDPCIDLLLTVVKGHILACCCRILGLDKLSHCPMELKNKIKQLKKAGTEERKMFIINLAEQVVKTCTVMESALIFGKSEDSVAYVFNYAWVLCHFGSILMEFRDACSEGDGERVIKCWKMFMLHFYANSSRSKYALESVKLLLQKHILPPRLSHELVWDRFINTHGGMGRNIQCDIYNEHVNREVKEIIQNMGPNLTEEALQRASRSVSTITKVCETFDNISHTPAKTSAHSTKTDQNDVGHVVSVVLRKKLLEKQIEPRQQLAFPVFKTNPLNTLKKDTILGWIENKVTEAVSEVNRSEKTRTTQLTQLLFALSFVFFHFLP